ncbi:MAG: cytochrome C, partial [Deltaproteobacteria bacterium]|nr:cytochrome C [Deltaproteobacteria bacterium]
PPKSSKTSSPAHAKASTEAHQPNAPAPVIVPGKGCARQGCHAGIEAFVDPKTGMGRDLLRRAKKVSDAEGCTICHGGKPDAPTKEGAHVGATPALRAQGGPDAFYPDPGSPWINKRSCGACHREQVFGQNNSLMMTEAGKIQGAYWAFGSKLGYQHKYANYATKNPADPASRLGSQVYRHYMDKLATLEPQVYPEKMEGLPKFPGAEAVAKDPSLAKLTYLRSECLRCHLGVRGRQKRGDYRGMGCSACHVPYGNEGLYEGKDKAISKTKRGHLLVHRLQATREHKVQVNGKTYSGIPVETCTTCHNRGKRIGVSFQGLMESAFSSPYANGAKKQPKLHSKHYLAMHQDIHYQKGMTCADCHTSIGVHGDGFLFGANLSQVQVECTDCHGTPEKYPWELPLGYGEEFEGRNDRGKARGLVRKLSPRLSRATVYPVEDGYVLTARGNAFRNVVRKGNRVIVHTAGGKDILMIPLKGKVVANTLKVDAKVAMVGVGRHIKKMECYSCHATWAPQCYGCHVRIDYSKGKRAFDWVAAGRKRQDPKHRAEDREEGYQTTVLGKTHEERSYMRWESPMMVNDGEGRVSPAIPGCQVSSTVVGPTGKVLTENKIYRSPGGTEGAGPKGQLTIDMSPVQPHTIGHARPCESCHASAKALGYGIGGGKLNRRWDRSRTVDLATADQKVLPRQTRVQIAAYKGLKNDWSRILDEKGKQQMTVGHHFKRSRPLDKDQRQRMDRRGVCLSCHEQIPRESVAINLLHHVAKTMNMLPKKREEHAALLTKILLLSGWGQVLGMAGGIAFVFVGGVWLFRRRRRRRGGGTGGTEGRARDEASTAASSEENKE